MTKRTRCGLQFSQIPMAISKIANRNTFTGSCKSDLSLCRWHKTNKKSSLFSSNIPNGDVSKGETIVPYLQPFPPKGTGYHRHIFILYKQEKKLDFSSYKVNKMCVKFNPTSHQILIPFPFFRRNDLDGRTFKTFDFYEKHQDAITPAGLAFFQSNWDKTLTDFYQNVLGMVSKKFFVFACVISIVFLCRHKGTAVRVRFREGVCS